MLKKSFFKKVILQSLNGPHSNVNSSNEPLSIVNIDHQSHLYPHLYRHKVDSSSLNLSTSVYSSVSLWPSLNATSCISCVYPIKSSSSVNWSTGKDIFKF